jgi:hypothetical protein
MRPATIVIGGGAKDTNSFDIVNVNLLKIVAFKGTIRNLRKNFSLAVCGQNGDCFDSKGADCSLTGP